MRKLAFYTDGIELLAHIGQAANDAYAVVSANLCFDNGRRHEQAKAFLPEDLQNRHIFDLSDDPWRDVLRNAPRVERATECGVGGGQQEGGAV